MFGVKKEQLVKGLCRLSSRLCCYMGNTCDCKYQSDSEQFLGSSSEATGCPETAMAAKIINEMTTQEFYAITRRAGIQISMPEESVKVDELMKSFKEQRKTVLQNSSKLSKRPKK